MKKIANIPVVAPDWDDMPWIAAFTTVAYDGDIVYSFRGAPENRSRKILREALPVREFSWLSLDHTTIVSRAPDHIESPSDAAIISEKQTAVAITTADCLPIVLADGRSRCAALIHAGWRGIAGGIIENCINMLNLESYRDTRVWIGPSVRGDYEIGMDVKEDLLAGGNVTEQAFVQINESKCFADLCRIVINKMVYFGIEENNISIFPESTIESRRFFSVRREGADTGRMATVVAIVS